MKEVLEIINLPSSARNFIGDQFSFLQKHGDYRMHLICSYDKAMDAFVGEQGIQYQAVKISRQIDIISDIKALVQICKYIRKNKIDIVIAHQAKSRMLGMLACLIMRVPNRVIFAHGVLYETMTGVKRWGVKQTDRMVSCIADKVVCVSHYVKDLRIKDHIDKPNKSVLLGYGSCNGIDTQHQFNPSLYGESTIQSLRKKYGIGEDDYIVGFCGRLVRDKGIIELVEGFSELVKRYPSEKIKLFIIGNPEVRDGLPSEIIAYLKEGKDIIYAGTVPYKDIAAYYCLMNVLVLPTRREGLGMVALEASAMERPVLVTSFTGGAETIQDGVTGSYIELTGKSIADKLSEYKNKEYAENIGKAGRRYVQERYERTIVNEAMLDFLNGL